MPQFRKKPVVIHAERVEDCLQWAMKNWCALPTWLNTAYERGEVVFGTHQIFIQTLEGRITAEESDWLLRGVNGELYPCKPDIFSKTYEKV